MFKILAATMFGVKSKDSKDDGSSDDEASFENEKIMSKNAVANKHGAGSHQIQQQTQQQKQQSQKEDESLNPILSKKTSTGGRIRGIEELFPFIKDINCQIRKAIAGIEGEACMQGNIMKAIRQYASDCSNAYDQIGVNQTVKCSRFAKSIARILDSIHNIYAPFSDSHQYLYYISKIVAVYISCELSSANDFREDDTVIANRILNIINKHLTVSVEDVSEANKLRMFSFIKEMYGRRGIMTKVFKECIPEPSVIIQRELPDKIYIQYLVVFYQWKQLETILEERNHVIDFANKFMRPARTLSRNSEYANHLPRYTDRKVATKFILENLKFFQDLRIVSIKDNYWTGDMRLIDLCDDDGIVAKTNLTNFAEIFTTVKIDSIRKFIKWEEQIIQETVDLTIDSGDDDVQNDITWLKKFKSVANAHKKASVSLLKLTTETPASITHASTSNIVPSTNEVISLDSDSDDEFNVNAATAVAPSVVSTQPELFTADIEEPERIGKRCYYGSDDDAEDDLSGIFSLTDEMDATKIAFRYGRTYEKPKQNDNNFDQQDDAGEGDYDDDRDYDDDDDGDDRNEEENDRPNNIVNLPCRSASIRHVSSNNSNAPMISNAPSAGSNNIPRIVSVHPQWNRRDSLHLNAFDEHTNDTQPEVDEGWMTTAAPIKSSSSLGKVIYSHEPLRRFTHQQQDAESDFDSVEYTESASSKQTEKQFFNNNNQTKKQVKFMLDPTEAKPPHIFSPASKKVALKPSINKSKVINQQKTIFSTAPHPSLAARASPAWSTAAASTSSISSKIAADKQIAYEGMDDNSIFNIIDKNNQQLFDQNHKSPNLIVSTQPTQESLKKINANFNKNLSVFNKTKANKNCNDNDINISETNLAKLNSSDISSTNCNNVSNLLKVDIIEVSDVDGNGTNDDSNNRILNVSLDCKGSVVVAEVNDNVNENIDFKNTKGNKSKIKETVGKSGKKDKESMETTFLAVSTEVKTDVLVADVKCTELNSSVGIDSRNPLLSDNEIKLTAITPAKFNPSVTAESIQSLALENDKVSMKQQEIYKPTRKEKDEREIEIELKSSGRLLDETEIKSTRVCSAIPDCAVAVEKMSLFNKETEISIVPVEEVNTCLDLPDVEEIKIESKTLTAELNVTSDCPISVVKTFNPSMPLLSSDDENQPDENTGKEHSLLETFNVSITLSNSSAKKMELNELKKNDFESDSLNTWKITEKDNDNLDPDETYLANRVELSKNLTSGLIEGIAKEPELASDEEINVILSLPNQVERKENNLELESNETPMEIQLQLSKNLVDDSSYRVIENQIKEIEKVDILKKTPSEINEILDLLQPTFQRKEPETFVDTQKCLQHEKKIIVDSEKNDITAKASHSLHSVEMGLIEKANNPCVSNEVKFEFPLDLTETLGGGINEIEVIKSKQNEKSVILSESSLILPQEQINVVNTTDSSVAIDIEIKMTEALTKALPEIKQISDSAQAEHCETSSDSVDLSQLLIETKDNEREEKLSYDLNPICENSTDLDLRYLDLTKFFDDDNSNGIRTVTSQFSKHNAEVQSEFVADKLLTEYIKKSPIIENEEFNIATSNFSSPTSKSSTSSHSSTTDSSSGSSSSSSVSSGTTSTSSSSSSSPCKEVSFAANESLKNEIIAQHRNSFSLESTIDLIDENDSYFKNSITIPSLGNDRSDSKLNRRELTTPRLSSATEHEDFDLNADLGDESQLNESEISWQGKHDQTKPVLLSIVDGPLLEGIEVKQEESHPYEDKPSTSKAAFAELVKRNISGASSALKALEFSDELFQRDPDNLQSNTTLPPKKRRKISEFHDDDTNQVPFIEKDGNSTIGESSRISAGANAKNIKRQLDLTAIVKNQIIKLSAASENPIDQKFTVTINQNSELIKQKTENLILPIPQNEIVTCEADSSSVAIVGESLQQQLTASSINGSSVVKTGAPQLTKINSRKLNEPVQLLEAGETEEVAGAGNNDETVTFPNYVSNMMFSVSQFEIDVRLTDYVEKIYNFIVDTASSTASSLSPSTLSGGSLPLVDEKIKAVVLLVILEKIYEQINVEGTEKVIQSLPVLKTQVSGSLTILMANEGPINLPMLTAQKLDKLITLALLQKQQKNVTAAPSCSDYDFIKARIDFILTKLRQESEVHLNSKAARMLPPLFTDTTVEQKEKQTIDRGNGKIAIEGGAGGKNQNNNLRSFVSNYNPDSEADHHTQNAQQQLYNPNQHNLNVNQNGKFPKAPQDQYILSDHDAKYKDVDPAKNYQSCFSEFTLGLQKLVPTNNEQSKMPPIRRHRLMHFNEFDEFDGTQPQLNHSNVDQGHQYPIHLYPHNHRPHMQNLSQPNYDVRRQHYEEPQLQYELKELQTQYQEKSKRKRQSPQQQQYQGIKLRNEHELFAQEHQRKPQQELQRQQQHHQELELLQRQQREFQLQQQQELQLQLNQRSQEMHNLQFQCQQQRQEHQHEHHPHHVPYNSSAIYRETQTPRTELRETIDISDLPIIEEKKKMQEQLNIIRHLQEQRQSQQLSQSQTFPQSLVMPSLPQHHEHQQNQMKFQATAFRLQSQECVINEYGPMKRNAFVTASKRITEYTKEQQIQIAPPKRRGRPPKQREPETVEKKVTATAAKSARATKKRQYKPRQKALIVPHSNGGGSSSGEMLKQPERPLIPTFLLPPIMFSSQQYKNKFT